MLTSMRLPNLAYSLLGTSDQLVIQNWYLGTQYQVEEFRFSDGSVLTASQAQGQLQAQAQAVTLLSAMAFFNDGSVVNWADDLNARRPYTITEDFAVQQV
jgi:hypothetical protein